MSKKRKINLTIYATEEQQKNLENYLKESNTSFLYIENLSMITNFRVVKEMSLNELATFLLANERIGLTWNNRDNLYNWLLQLYEESDPIWKEMRHIWDN